MIRSMTGQSRINVRIEELGLSVDIEIRSQNHRFLEVSIKGPTIIFPFEDDLRRMVRAKVERGHIICYMQVDQEVAAVKVTVEEALLKNLITMARRLKRRFKLAGALSVDSVFQFPGVVKFSKETIDEQRFFKLFGPVFDRAVDSFVEMKKREGKNIADSLMSGIGRIRSMIAEIEKVHPEREAKYRQGLEKLIKQYFESPNRDRLNEEVLYFLERSDITEESTRLSSHCELFTECLEKERFPGRRMNFLLQEMLKEANTLGVKAYDAAISQFVVRIKEEVEKLREQVQNVE